MTNCKVWQDKVMDPIASSGRSRMAFKFERLLDDITNKDI